MNTLQKVKIINTLTAPMVTALQSAAITGTITAGVGTVLALGRRGLAVHCGRRGSSTWQITAAGWELLPADMRCRAVAIAHRDALAEAYRRIPTGPCVVCGEPDAQSMGGEPECTPCAKLTTAEMKAARLAGQFISTAEARQRAMRALAKGAEMAREMALRMWGQCYAGSNLDAVARAVDAGEYRRAYELAAAQVARQDANAGCVQDVEQAHAEALEAEAGLRPKYTPGTRQYREYHAALTAELAKWVGVHEATALDKLDTCPCVTH